MNSYHPNIVLGLDVLIGNPDILTPDADTPKKADKIFLPEQYVDRVDDFYDEMSNRGDACRILMGIFTQILEERNGAGSAVHTAKNGMQIEFVSSDKYKVPYGRDSRSSKGQAVGVAKHVMSIEPGTPLAIMTGTDRTSALAALNRIDVAHVNPEVYTGRRRVELPLEYAGWWNNGKNRLDQGQWAEAFPDEKPLKYNEFVELVIPNYGQNGTFRNIGRFDPETNALIPLKYLRNLPRWIKPRTAGQAMLAEALMAPPDEIPLVICSGVFGTGKTFLAVALGVYQTEGEESMYERVFICPRDGALGEQIGFVPGDTTAKTRVKAKPIEDNLREYLKIRKDIDKADLAKLKRNGNGNGNGNGNSESSGRRVLIDRKVEKYLAEYFGFEPIINMGGRSLSEMFIIFDEFQDMERYQAKALLTRIGNGSKNVVMGDPTQLTNPHLNATSNGLSYSASKLAGQRHAAVITLTKQEIVRSKAARTIADCFA